MAPNDVTLPVRPWNLRGALAVAAIPTIAYIPAVVFRLPDNGHEASLGLFVTLAGLLFSWASSGHNRRSHSRAATTQGERSQTSDRP